MRQAAATCRNTAQVRSRARDFLELCLTPALAAELTLQPIRRFGMDAAILFSDILVLPHALGQRLAFPRGRRAGAGALIVDKTGAKRLDPRGALARLDPVLRRCGVSRGTRPQTALIGFAGAPWTVATYMVEGGSSRDFRRSRAGPIAIRRALAR